MKLPRGAEILPERYRALMLFMLSLACLYFTAVNVPVMRGQLTLNSAPWASTFASIWMLSAPIITLATALALIAERYHWQKPHRDVIQFIADLCCWWGAANTVVLSALAIALYYITGKPLFHWQPGEHIATPFLLLTFIIAVVYAMTLGYRYIITFVAVQSILGAVMSVSVGANVNLAIADFAYGFVFSAIIVGAIFILMRGLDGLEQSVAITRDERLAAFQLEAQLDEDTHVNALLHDYIIAVTVVVGRKLQVSANALRQAAKAALQVLDSLRHAASLDNISLPSLQNFGGEEEPRQLPARREEETLLQSEHLTLTAWIMRARTIAKSEGFTFTPRGIWVRILLSAVVARHLNWVRLPQYVICSDVVVAGLEAMKEAMRNARRHAAARHHRVEVRAKLWAGPQVVVSIVDDGAGFDPNQKTYGFGVRNSIIARINNVGGQAQINAAPQAGCTVTLTLPLTHPKHVQEPVANPEVERMRRNPGDEYLSYATHPNVRIIFIAILPVLWIHVIVTLMHALRPADLLLVGAGLTVLFLRISFAPASWPPLIYRLYAILAGAVLPALSLGALPTSPHPSQGTFVFPFLVIVQLWMWVRGAWGSALVSFITTTISFVAASYYYGFAAPMPWDVVERNFGTIAFVVLYVMIVSNIYQRIQNELDSQDYLRELQAVRKRVLAARKTRVGEIDREIRPLLAAIAAGADPGPLQTIAAVTEEQLRDAIRADRLSISPLREAVYAARIRGVMIRLADDSKGRGDLTPLIELATTTIQRAGASERVTVRALPPGHEHLGTVLVTSESGDVELTRVPAPMQPLPNR